ncbi:RICIN domain-containing protein [Amycolatopsis azurea]|uniref:RICIN domain-containing protein n=1 Tax=Amycolatopsis azurea TaxID=36819 RepID=UPI0038044EC7
MIRRPASTARFLLSLLAACVTLLATPVPAMANMSASMPLPDFTLSTDPKLNVFLPENYTAFIRDIRERLGQGGAPVTVPTTGGEPTQILSMPAEAPGYIRLRIEDDRNHVTLFMRLQNAYIIGYAAYDDRSNRTTYYQLRDEPVPAEFEERETERLHFNGNYVDLERNAGEDTTRSTVTLGASSLYEIVHDPRPMADGRINQRKIAKNLLVLIQMVAEAARFRAIESLIARRMDEGLNAPPEMLQLENNWSLYSGRIRNAEGGTLEPPVEIGTRNYPRVSNLAVIMGILAFQCHPVPYARAAEPQCPTPLWAGSVVSWVNRTTGRFLDNGGSAVNGAPILQQVRTGALRQEWRLIDAGDSSYYLVNAASEKVVETGDTSEDVALFQYSQNGNPWQKWRVEDAGDGAYYLVNVASGKVADSLGGTGDDPVVQRSRSGKDSQQWLPQFIDTVPTYTGAVAKLVNLGTTQIASTDDSDQDGDHLIMETFGYSSRSAWRLENAGDNSYYLANVLTGKVVENGGNLSDAKLIQWSKNGKPWQKWRLHQKPDKQGYSLVNVESRKVMQGIYDSTHDGAYLVQASDTGDVSQLWSLTLLNGYPALAGRPLTFTNADTGKVIDNGGDSGDGAQIYQRNGASGSSSQQWRLEFRDHSQAWIINEASGKALENGNDSRSGARLIQWSRNKEPWQQWRLTGGNRVQLQHVTSGLTADTSEMGVDAPLVLRENAASQTAQQWMVTVQDDLPAPPSI